MMILPLADALQNCLQNLTSRIAGVDNEQMTGRVMGMGAMMGYGLGAIKEQFKSPSSNSSNNSGKNEGTKNGLQGLVSRAKSVINPTANLSPEKDYNGNVNPIRNVLPKQKTSNKITIPTPNENNTNNTNNMQNDNKKSMLGKVAKTGFNATKAYLDIGARMAEGDFNNRSYKMKSNNKKTNFQNTEYLYKINNDEQSKNLGDKNES